MSTHFERLQAETEAPRAALLSLPFIRAGAAGQLSLAGYIAFLTQAYHHVKHTVPLLMACGARLPADKEWLRDAMGAYIDEETGHQEWILADIAACGADPLAVRNGEPDVAAELMVAYAYDLIARGNPVAFLGMVHVLEGTSVHVAAQAAANLQTTLGLTDQAFTYLTSHGSLDIEHVAFFEGLVNRLDASDLRDVVHAARVFYRLYGDIFAALPLATPARRGAA